MRTAFKDNIRFNSRVINGVNFVGIDNGMFIDVKFFNREVNDCSSKSPMFAWAAAEIYKKDKDITFVERVYPKLAKNEEFRCRERFYKSMFHYGADINNTPFNELDLNIRFESGWDDSVRRDKPCADYCPIDLNCCAVMMYRGLFCNKFSRSCVFVMEFIFNF